MRHNNKSYTELVLFLIAAISMSLAAIAPRSAAQSELPDNGPPQSIAFQSNRDENPNAMFNEIYVMNADGSEQNRITFNPGVDQQPDISPNGKQIVFASTYYLPDTNPDSVLQIFLMNLDGSLFPDGNVVKQLTFTAVGTFNSWPRWSPNGREIAFHSSADGDFEIFTVRPDGTGLRQITHNTVLDQFPAWSPNGRQLAIRRGNELFIIDRDGANPVQLTTSMGMVINQMASWSPDGKTLAFLSNREGYGSVFLTDTAGETQINLTPKPATIVGNTWSSRAPDWSRNGRYIYFTGVRPETCNPMGLMCREQIFVMNADGSGVTQITFEGSNAVASVR